MQNKFIMQVIQLTPHSLLILSCHQLGWPVSWSTSPLCFYAEVDMLYRHGDKHEKSKYIGYNHSYT